MGTGARASPGLCWALADVLLSVGVALVVPQWPRCPSPTARPQSGSVSACPARDATRSGLVAGRCFEPARARRACLCGVLLLRGGTAMEAGVVCSSSLKGTLASPKGKGAGEQALKPPQRPQSKPALERGTV